MAVRLCTPFASLSEFSSGHNDTCGPCAEEVAVATLQGRGPNPFHMEAIRNRQIGEGWFVPKKGVNSDGVYQDFLKYEGGSGTVIPSGTSSMGLQQVLTTALLAGQPCVVGLRNAKALPHNEPGVMNHFITLGGVDTDKGIALVANGDYWDGTHVILSGPTPLYWASWAELAGAGMDSAVIFRTTTTALAKAPWGPKSAALLWPWLIPLTDPHISKHWDGQNELGVDIQMPMGTEITSLTYGRVLNSFYFGGGGVVVVQSVLPKYGTVAFYYQHLDMNTVAIGDIVHIGDIIGYSGGQLKGGHHPATCCSTGAHMEIGWDGGSAGSQWRGMGHNTDPLPYLLDLVASGPPPADLVRSGQTAAPNGAAALLDSTSNAVSGQGPAADSFAALMTAIDSSMQIVPVVNLNNLGDFLGLLFNPDTTKNAEGNIGHDIAAVMLRAMIVVIGVSIILAFLFHLAQPLLQMAPEIAATGALVAA